VSLIFVKGFKGGFMKIVIKAVTPSADKKLLSIVFDIMSDDDVVIKEFMSRVIPTALYSFNGVKNLLKEELSPLVGSSADTGSMISALEGLTISL
jgi:hypothetical protein